MLLDVEPEDRERDEKAGQVLRDHDFTVSSVDRAQQTLESVFMDRVGRETGAPNGGGSPADVDSPADVNAPAAARMARHN